MIDTIFIINGPNLNLVGKREVSVYGTKSMEEFVVYLLKKYTNVQYFQSNIEGEIIDKLQEVGYTCKGIVLNAGAYTHTSIAIADCVKAISTPVVEVHISNVLAREDYRKISYVSAACVGSISGLGLMGYELALDYFTCTDK